MYFLLRRALALESRLKSSLAILESMASRMEGYEVKQVKSDDTNCILAFLKRTFYIDGPMHKAIDLCSDSACTELDEYYKHSLLEGLSFKAVDKDGNIVGVIINGVVPLRSDAKEVMLKKARECQSPKFQKILYIKAEREDARLWEKFAEDDKMVEIKVGATDPAWRRRGISNALGAKTEEEIKKKNIRLLRVDCSSAYSAMSAEKFGFTCMRSVKYTDIKKDGVPLIVPEPPHVDDRVYVKCLWELGAKTDACLPKNLI